MDGKTDRCLEDLARRMAALENSAYQEFARTFGPRLKGLFLRHGLSVTAAEDLAANCVTDIALKIHQYRTLRNGCFSAWVLTLARHAMADWWKGTHPSASLNDRETAQAAYEPDFEDMGEAAAALTATVERVLMSLSPEDRRILTMRYFGGEYTFAEIAEQLNMQEGTVRQRHSRALKKLKDNLQQDPAALALLSRPANTTQGDEDAR